MTETASIYDGGSRKNGVNQCFGVGLRRLWLGRFMKKGVDQPVDTDVSKK
jgi:hypothetical protein